MSIKYQNWMSLKPLRTLWFLILMVKAPKNYPVGQSPNARKHSGYRHIRPRERAGMPPQCPPWLLRQLLMGIGIIQSVI